MRRDISLGSVIGQIVYQCKCFTLQYRTYGGVCDFTSGWARRRNWFSRATCHSRQVLSYNDSQEQEFLNNAYFFCIGTLAIDTADTTNPVLSIKAIQVCVWASMCLSSHINFLLTWKQGVRGSPAAQATRHLFLSLDRPSWRSTEPSPCSKSMATTNTSPYKYGTTSVKTMTASPLGIWAQYGTAFRPPQGGATSIYHALATWFSFKVL
jgi:hypothetical protein